MPVERTQGALPVRTDVQRMKGLTNTMYISITGTQSQAFQQMMEETIEIRLGSVARTPMTLPLVWKQPNWPFRRNLGGERFLCLLGLAVQRRDDPKIHKVICFGPLWQRIYISM